MNLSEWFRYQLQAGADGFVWAMEQLPEECWMYVASWSSFAPFGPSRSRCCHSSMTTSGTKPARLSSGVR